MWPPSMNHSLTFSLHQSLPSRNAMGDTVLILPAKSQMCLKIASLKILAPQSCRYRDDWYLLSFLYFNSQRHSALPLVNGPGGGDGSNSNEVICHLRGYGRSSKSLLVQFSFCFSFGISCKVYLSHKVTLGTSRDTE